MSLEIRSQTLCHGGSLIFASHLSTVCRGMMRFAVFIPPQAKRQKLPVLYFLAGLTCTEENFIVKAGALKFAVELGLILVAPDTSPRQTGIPEAIKDWDFGEGAGFYVDAIIPPYDRQFQMYSYITRELPQIVADNFPADLEREGICGHSMGGHGALVTALRNGDRFKSVSAFAPICAPTQCLWGTKAFRGYLGEDASLWQQYDAVQLLQTKPEFIDYQRPILIDQGTEDSFLPQLMPDKFASACAQAGQPLSLRMQAGYDHSYYFIQTFIGDHLQHHAKALGGKQ